MSFRAIRDMNSGSHTCMISILPTPRNLLIKDTFKQGMDAIIPVARRLTDCYEFKVILDAIAGARSLSFLDSI